MAWPTPRQTLVDVRHDVAVPGVRRPIRRSGHPFQPLVAMTCISDVKPTQFSHDPGVVSVDVRGIDHPEEAIVQRSVFVGFDRHGAGEKRDALARLGEVVGDRHATLEAAVAVAIMAEIPDRVEDEQLRSHGDRKLPREYAIFLRMSLGPGVAHLQGKQSLSRHID